MQNGEKCLGSPENKDAGFTVENGVQELLEAATRSFYGCVLLLKSL